MDVIPRLDLKLSNTRWRKYSEGRLQISPATKKEECCQIFCLWLTPMALSRNWSCSSLDSHLCSRQGPSPQTAWLEIFRPITRHCHIWRTSMTLLRTSHQCDARREDLKIYTSPTLHRQFNHTAASPPTAIKFLLKRESRRMKTSTIMANHDPRMNRTNLKISRVVRHHWYLKYPVWFLQLFVVCLVCSW
jgi:hypothetical protein